LSSLGDGGKRRGKSLLEKETREGGRTALKNPGVGASEETLLVKKPEMRRKEQAKGRR